MHRQLPLLQRAIAPLLVAALLAGCASQSVIVTEEWIRLLYDFVLVAAAVVFVIFAGLIGWSIVRNRDRDRGVGDAAPVTWHKLPLELVWWAIPTLLAIVLFILSARAVDGIHE